MYSLIVTAKMSSLDPQAWLADAPGAYFSVGVACASFWPTEALQITPYKWVHPVEER